MRNDGINDKYRVLCSLYIKAQFRILELEKDLKTANEVLKNITESNSKLHDELSKLKKELSAHKKNKEYP